MFYDLRLGYLCFIEVKGCIDGVDSVMVMCQEVIILLYELEKFILVIVFVNVGFVYVLCYVCGLFVDWELLFLEMVI